MPCGVIRNSFTRHARTDGALRKHLGERPRDYSYHPVGYMISCESMREDVAAIHAQQQAIGYESVFIEGLAESERYMKGLFSDWRAQSTHEMPGGYANTLAMHGLAAKANRRAHHPLPSKRSRVTVMLAAILTGVA